MPKKKRKTRASKVSRVKKKTEILPLVEFYDGQKWFKPESAEDIIKKLEEKLASANRLIEAALEWKYLMDTPGLGRMDYREKARPVIDRLYKAIAVWKVENDKREDS